ncbi:MAG: hypothetical protein RL404_619, partial [Pseudomonadota bacterium]
KPVPLTEEEAAPAAVAAGEGKTDTAVIKH